MEYFNPSYGKVRQRTLEWAEGEKVSLLDLEGIGAGTRRALRKVGIETASQLLRADADQLARDLMPYNIPPCKPHDKRVAIVKSWQEMIARQQAEWKNRQ